MAGAIYQTKLTADTSQHDQALGRSANQVYNYKKKCEETDKGVGKLMGKFAKFASVLSVAKIAGDTFNSMMTNNQAMADRYGSTMESITAITDQFAYSISTFDFTNMFNGLGSIIDRAKEYYNALDKLQTLQITLIGSNAELDAQMANARRRFKEGDKSAADDIRRIGDLMLKNVKDEQDAIKDELEKFVDLKTQSSGSATKGGFFGGLFGNHTYTAQSRDFVLDLEDVIRYTDDAARGGHELATKIAEARAEYERLKAAAQEYNEGNAEHWQPVAQAEADLKQLEAIQNKLSDGENLQHINEQYAKYWRLQQQYDDMQRRNLRYLNEGPDAVTPTVKVKPQVVAPKPEEILPEGSIAELEKKLSDLKLKWRMATTDEGDEGRIALKKLIDQTQADLDKMMGVEKKPAVKVDVDTDEPPEGSIAKIRKLIAEKQAKLDNSSDPKDRIRIRVEIEGLEQEMERIAEAMKTPTEKITEKIDAIENKYREMGETVRTVSGMMANAVSTWAEIDQLAFEANEENMTEAEKAEHKRTQAYLKGTAQIIDAVGQAIPAILSLVGAEEAEALAAGTAQAAKLAYPANLAAIATVVASVMTVAATIASLINASKFANGGIVDAASRVGDHNIIRVNGGEMILNDRQQSNLFKLLNGEFWEYFYGNNFGYGKHETIQLRISGSDLVGTLDNYNRQQSRAR